MGGICMSVRLSKLFGMDVYDFEAGYKGKVYDIIINLEKGKLETITTEPLKVKTKSDAKKILSEKSIPYRNVKSVKDIVIVSSRDVPFADLPQEKEEQAPTAASQLRYKYSRR
ncbi:MAG: PRC-barrel domain-containing protein [Candidatus Diapherotrites archaeon]|nr:PRC-barrel domain-containing protein [Candidatus Diapherotrites archaeon]